MPPSTTPEEKNPHFATPSGEHEGLWSMQWVQHREVRLCSCIPRCRFTQYKCIMCLHIRLSFVNSVMLLYLLYRCESFNGLMRNHNIYANREAPSRDIARSFAVIDHLRFICSGGTNSATDRFDNHPVLLFNFNRGSAQIVINPYN